MLSIRIVGAAAVMAMMAGSAAAQTATQAPVAPAGRPIQLLQILEKPHKPAAKAQLAARPAAKPAKHAKAHLALGKSKAPHGRIRTAKAAAPAAWPADDSTNLPDSAAPASMPPPAAAVPAPKSVAVAGQTVQVASPDDVNEIDLAADDDPAEPAAGIKMASNSLDDASLASQSVESASAPRENGMVGSASWIAQVLAALAGAIAAGSVAWFLIGSGPQRSYG